MKIFQVKGIRGIFIMEKVAKIFKILDLKSKILIVPYILKL